MNINNQLPLYALVINLLTTQYTLSMEHKLTYAMRQRYAYLREIAVKLDMLTYARHEPDTEDKKARLLQSLEPEEIILIEQASLLSRDYSRPVGRLLKFLNAEERLREKIKLHFNLYGELSTQPAENIFLLSQPDRIEQDIMPWEMIAPQTTSMQTQF